VDVITIGIDPGLTGAIAFLSRNTTRVFDLPTVPIPGDGTVKRRVHGPGLHDLILEHCPADEACCVLIEDVMKTTGGQGSSAQTLGSQAQTFGTIQCCVEILGLAPRLLHAKTWKKFYSLGSDKHKSLDVARGLWPAMKEISLVKHHNRAEALLIAHFGVRHFS